MPPPTFGRARVPVGSVPMKFPSTTLPPLTSSEIASKPNRLRTMPRTMELPPLMTRPVICSPLPVSSTLPVTGCVVPSMITGWSIRSRPDCSVIVGTPPPGMLKTMVSRSPLSAFEISIACRRDPGPLSAVVVTTSVLPVALTIGRLPGAVVGWIGLRPVARDSGGELERSAGQRPESERERRGAVRGQRRHRPDERGTRRFQRATRRGRGAEHRDVRDLGIISEETASGRSPGVLRSRQSQSGWSPSRCR